MTGHSYENLNLALDTVVPSQAIQLLPQLLMN